MQNQSTKRLIVEGSADKHFFASLCRELGCGDIWIGPPTEHDQGGNGKGNAFQALSDYLEEITTGHVTHLGIVIDADFCSSSQNDGFQATYSEISKRLNQHGYLQHGDGKAGFIFTHLKNLPNIGVWIMPDNKSDGYLEQFCIHAASKSEACLLDHAKRAVATLTNPKFSPHKLAKAEISTWLAWQTDPGQGLNSLIGGNLLDTESSTFKSLTFWLKTIFLLK